MVIAFGLSDFGKDIKSNNPTLLVRMGWRDGMNLHNLLILSAYLLLGLATTFGLPVLITFPAILPLPLGLLQIWQMIRIGTGAKPNWRLLHINAVALFTATVYLLTFGFWTR
jgi:1,4-dihydroxy-2-naphthoate octaprenyltransferase